MFIGTIDGFERRIELDSANGVFAEIIPDNNLQPVNFFLNEKFFSAPPAFAEVYLMDGDALINIREYGAKDVKLNVVCQTRFCGNLITVFSQGGVYLSAEGEEYDLSPLPLAFADAGTEVKTLAGREVLAIRSNDPPAKKDIFEPRRERGVRRNAESYRRVRDLHRGESGVRICVRRRTPYADREQDG